MSKTRAELPVRSPARGRRQRKPDEKSTWKTYEKSEKAHPANIKGENFVNMDEYLRGGGKQVSERMAKKKAQLARSRVGEMAMSLDGGSSIDTLASENMYRGKVLIAYENSSALHEAASILEDAFFDVHIARDG